MRASSRHFTDLKEAVRVAYATGPVSESCAERSQAAEITRISSSIEEFLPMNVDRMCLYWRNGWQ